MNTETTVMPTKLYKIPEVAKLWGICERSVRRAIADGRLRCVRVGRSVRVSDEQLRAYIEEYGR